MFQADRTVSVMALSRKDLACLRKRKEGSETRRQCVKGTVEQEEDRETGVNPVMQFWG